MKKRTICFIITSHIHYARSKLVLDAIRNDPRLKLQIVVGASAILPQYGDALSLMKKDGYAYDTKITMTLAGGTNIAMAKTTGVGILEFAAAFENLQPDMVVVRGDRYEILAAAVAAAYMNIPIAHIEGGDVTGSIDESVRHAVTKLAHVHMATNDKACERIIRMGENPKFVFNVGSPDIEQLVKHRKNITSKELNRYGVGADINLQKPYLLVIHHPVTTQAETNNAHTQMLLEEVARTGMQAIWFWPNVDAGTDDVSKAIRVFRENHEAKHMRFAKYVTADEFLALLKGCACIIGNSSAGIKEASFLGVPSVNVGIRQAGRLRGENVIDVDYEQEAMRRAIKKQSAHGRYEASSLYHKTDSSKLIANILATAKPSIQKSFFDADV